MCTHPSLFRYAVGITLLVCLTNHPAARLIDESETQHGDDFADIAGEAISEPTVWPPRVANTVKELTKAKSAGPCLCAESKRKRLALPRMLEVLAQLLEENQAEPALPPATAESSSGMAYAPSLPSLLVRKLGAAAVSDGGAEVEMRLQRNASNAFDALMRRLDVIYESRAAEAPADFVDRIDFWRLPAGLHSGMHRLRVWRNTGEHRDGLRWQREGPRSEAEFIELASMLERGLDEL